MKNLFLTVAVLALSVSTASAGPLRNMAQNVKERHDARVAARHSSCSSATISSAQTVRTTSCQFSTSTSGVSGNCTNGKCDLPSRSGLAPFGALPSGR